MVPNGIILCRHHILRSTIGISLGESGGRVGVLCTHVVLDGPGPGPGCPSRKGSKECKRYQELHACRSLLEMAGFCLMLVYGGGCRERPIRFKGVEFKMYLCYRQGHLGWRRGNMLLQLLGCADSASHARKESVGVRANRFSPLLQISGWPGIFDDERHVTLRRITSLSGESGVCPSDNTRSLIQRSKPRSSCIYDKTPNHDLGAGRLLV